MTARTIFLSASVPSEERAEKYRRIRDAQIQIDDAVVALCRALFSRGGQLVFGGHPAISPLVAMVAGEYAGAAEKDNGVHAAGPRASLPVFVRIYQSGAFEGSLPDETLLMYHLGYAEIRWVEAAPGERFDPADASSVRRIGNSLKAMRERMILESQPDAMVCIGGMEGTEEEFALFRQRRPAAPVYVMEATGGAAAILAQEQASSVRIPDREVLSRTPRRTVPYPMIMEMLLQEVSQLPAARR